MDYLLKIVLFSFPAGRIFGIPLRINWLVLVLFVVPMLRDLVVVAGGPESFGWAFVLLMGTISFVVLYGSILLHELGHLLRRLINDDPENIYKQHLLRHADI